MNKAVYKTIGRPPLYGQSNRLTVFPRTRGIGGVRADGGSPAEGLVRDHVPLPFPIPVKKGNVLRSAKASRHLCVTRWVRPYVVLGIDGNGATAAPDAM